MSNNIDEDDDVFYGKKKKAAEQKPAQSGSSVYGSSYGNVPPPSSQRPQPQAGQDQPQEQERDIEKEISDTRREKQHAAEIHDITIIRQKAAKHASEAAKLFKKYRGEEAAMVKYTEAANKARRVSEKYEQKSKDATSKADEKQADVQYVEGAKAEKLRVKVAKLHAKAAKLHARSIEYQSKAAKLTAKAAAKREKAKALLEQSKTHEAEASAHNKRADKLQKAMAGQ
jgi:uncharacterized phage infection (PIP) family protein YhgE